MSTAAVGLNNPYPGLRPFEPADADYFFGRDRQVDELLLALRDHRFVAVLGLSGSGKSSLVRAGLVPALKAGHLTSSGAHWRVALFRPGHQPLEALAAALDDALGRQPGRLEKLFDSTNALLLHTRADRAPEENLLVVVDQFEELFRVANHRDAARFVDLLLAAGQDISPSFRVFVVLTMRTDRLGECARFDGLPEALNSSQYLVPRLTSEQLHQAIEGPAALTGTAVAPELAQKLVIEASEGRDQLPLLQHLLMILWEHRQIDHDGSSLISLSEYQAAGSAADALNAHADAVLSELPQEQHTLASLIFRALTEAGEGRDQRRPQRLSELAKITGADEKDVHDVVKHFLDASFLTSPDRGHTEDWEVDITHESLIRQWKQLADWVADEVKDAEDYRYFRERGKRRAGPLTDVDLDVALKWEKKNHNEFWAARYGGDFEATVEYIRTSQAARKEAEGLAEKARTAELERKERDRRRAYVLAAVFFVIAIAIGVLALYAWRARATANREAERANEEKRNTARALHQATEEEQLALHAKATAERATSTAEEALVTVQEEKHNAQTALGRSAVQDGLKRFEDGHPDEAAAYFARALRSDPDSVAAKSWLTDLLMNHAWWLPGKALQHQDNVNYAAFSPNGRRIVTVRGGKTAQVWDVESGKLVGAPLPHKADVDDIAFSPDGRRVVTASGGTAFVWDVESGKRLRILIPNQADVSSTTLSRDGRRIVTASGGTAQVWDIDTGKPVGAPLLHKDEVMHIGFSPDGRRIVSVTKSTTQVWEAETGKPVGPVLLHQGSIDSLALSSDGNLIATASADTTQVWDVEAGEPIGAPIHHQRQISPYHRVAHVTIGGSIARVHYLGFSPDDRHIITVAEDTAQVWNIVSGTPVGAPLLHQDTIHFAIFSPDGDWIVTASDDQTAQVWDAATGKQVGAPLRHKDIVNSVAFSPDGRHIVTASDDETARVWHAATGKAADITLRVQTPDPDSAKISSDGRRMLVRVDESTLRLWDVETGKSVGAPLRHQSPVVLAAIGPDGRRVLTTSLDGTAQVWETETGKPVGRLFRSEDVVTGVWFSPGGRRILAVHKDTAQVRDADTGKPVGVRLELDAPVGLAVFSGDERRILTVSRNNTPRVWDADTGRPLGKSLQYDEPIRVGSSLNLQVIRSAAFTPHGYRLITTETTESGSTAQVSDAETGKKVGAPLRYQIPVLSVAISRDGRRVLTTYADGAAQVWETETGKPVGAKLQLQGEVKSARFSTDGNRVITASADGTVQVWEADTGKTIGSAIQYKHRFDFTAQFSPDGRRVLIASEGIMASEGSVLVLPVMVACCASQQEADRLAGLAEAVSGSEVSDTGSLTFIDGSPRLQKLLRESGIRPEPQLTVDWLIRSFAPPKATSAEKE
jgi:WD40 repeat protein